MRGRLTIVAAALAMAVLPSCSSGGTDDTFVLTVNGTADVTGPDGTEHLDDGRHKVAPGETVHITKGNAVLGLPGDGTLELRAGRRIRAAQAGTATAAAGRTDSRLRVGARPELLAGDALVDSGGDAVRLVAGGATLSVDRGAARVRRSSGVTLAVYRGEANVDALGRTLPRPVSAFRQVAVADTGALPRRAVPLVYDRAHPDPWDVRYLGDAIDFGGQLDRRALALNRQLTPSSPDVTLLTSIVPTLRSTDGFDGGLVDETKSVGESVVGASIALSGPGDFVRRWNAAFQFRDDGADWGLVALDQRAKRDSVFGLLDGALDRLPSRFVGGPIISGPTTTTSRPGGGGSSTTTTTQPTGTPGPIPPPDAPDPLGDLVDPILGEPDESQSPGLLGDLVDDVGGLFAASTSSVVVDSLVVGVQPLGVLRP
jgi:hypothetical protein